MEIEIAIPSKGRAGFITSQKIFKSGVLYIPESELMQYSIYPNKIVKIPNEVKGITQTRNWILNYNKNNKVTDNRLSKYNSKDATNNFFKIITEFGIFGFSIYLLLLFVLIDKKVSIENKIFLFSFLISQSIRGAGYFNGGFLLVMFILLISQFIHF